MSITSVADSNQPLARLGADVTGIDASISNIKAAEHHANKDPMLQGKLKYMATTAGKSNCYCLEFKSSPTQRSWQAKDFDMMQYVQWKLWSMCPMWNNLCGQRWIWSRSEYINSGGLSSVARGYTIHVHCQQDDSLLCIGHLGCRICIGITG